MSHACSETKQSGSIQLNDLTELSEKLKHPKSEIRIEVIRHKTGELVSSQVIHKNDHSLLVELDAGMFQFRMIIAYYDNDHEKTEEIIFDKNILILENNCNSLTNPASKKSYIQNTNYDSMVLFPNPIRNKLTISLTKASRIIVVSLDGVLIEDIILDTNNNTLDLSSLSGGIYILKNMDSGEVRKIIKSK